MRFRPRFSVRTLAIFVTSVCVYFGAWEATKKYGLPVVLNDEAEQADSPMPLVIREVTSGFYLNAPYAIHHTSEYYLWLFGPKMKLPIGSTWKE